MRSIRSDATWLMPHGRSPRTGVSRWSASSRSGSAWEGWSRSRPSLALIAAPARVINTNGLAELLVLPLGPLRAKAGEWALEQWSYRGLSGVAGRRHRDGHHGVDHGVQPIRRAGSGRRRRPLGSRRCTSRPTTSARLACRSRADRDSIPRSTTRHWPSRASS